MGLMNQPAGARTVIDSVRYLRRPMSRRRRRALSRAAAPQCRVPSPTPRRSQVTELLRGERHGPALTSLASGLGLPLDALAEYNARAPAPQRAPVALDSVEEAHVPDGLAPAPAVID